MKKSILITGSTGFIGQNLTKLLLSLNYKVLVLIRKESKNKLFVKKTQKNNKNFHPIYFNNINILPKKISKLKINYVINLATKWIDKHNYKDLIDLINSNILFNTAVLDVVPKKNLKKFINVSTYALFKTSKKYNPYNLYAATKKSFEDIIAYYQNNYKKTYFYNLYLYDNYGVNDKRSKIIAKILKDYKANKKTTILSNKVELNLLNVSEICKAFRLILEKKINSGNYLIRAKKFTNILDLIKKTNIKLNKKIKYNLLNKPIRKKIDFKMNLLPYWKPSTFIEKEIFDLIDENN
jgi:CDP-paratose synthetase